VDDPTAIDAIGVETVQVVMSEYGPDLSRFPTEGQFVSHLTLIPNKPMSGGKAVRKKKRRGTGSTRAAAAGGSVDAPQPDWVGSLLPPDRAAYRRRCRGSCLRKTIPGTPDQHTKKAPLRNPDLN
jgi:hypothetical protein